MTNFNLFQGVDNTALDLSTCGKSKGCYTKPNECTSNCDVAVTWIKDGSNGFKFEMSSKDDYVALGFSTDADMVNII